MKFSLNHHVETSGTMRSSFWKSIKQQLNELRVVQVYDSVGPSMFPEFSSIITSLKEVKEFDEESGMSFTKIVIKLKNQKWEYEFEKDCEYTYFLNHVKIQDNDGDWIHITKPFSWEEKPFYLSQ